jgi:hypothetical protein
MFKVQSTVKLVGSKMENDFRRELIRSNEGLQDPVSKLRQVLESEGFNTIKAYVLNWAPEQLEDIYLVLIDGSFLVRVEIDKYDKSKPPILERIELREYLRGLSKMNQVRLAVAKELAHT